MHLVGTILAALAAAVCFALSAVLQQQSARAAPSSESLHLSLLVSLARRRRWLLGVGVMNLAYGLESLALALGDVTLVEPVVVTELVFALAIGAWMRHRRVGVQEWLGVVSVVGGVTAFLAAAGPGERRIGAPPSLTHWLLALLPCAGAVGGSLLLARRSRPWARAGLLGAGAGVAFGLLAVLTRVCVGIFERHGASGLFESWEPYVLLSLGLGGFLLSQSAYQAAPLSGSLPLIDSTEPVTAVVIAATVLGERIDLAGPALAVEAVGAALAIAGVFLLGRSPVVISTYRADPDPAPALTSSPEAGLRHEVDGLSSPQGTGSSPAPRRGERGEVAGGPTHSPRPIAPPPRRSTRP